MHKKKIIVWLLVIFFSFAAWWGYGQWQLLDHLLEEKGNMMHEKYYSYLIYFKTMEELTADILLSEELEEVHQDKIRWLQEDYRVRNKGNFNRYGLVKGELKYNELRDFMHLTYNFFGSLSRQEGNLEPETREYLEKLHVQARELNEINKQYQYQIQRLYGKDFFYSNIWVEALNKMNATFEGHHPYQTFAYPSDREQPGNIIRPPVEKVFGTEVSQKQAREKAQAFLGDFAWIKEGSITSSGTMAMDGDVMLDHVGFAVENGYQIEVLTQGGKVIRFTDQAWRDSRDDEKKPYVEPVLNISPEEALEKLKDFLVKRDFPPMDIQQTSMTDRHLRVTLFPMMEDYLNYLAPVEATLDLTQEGKILELDLFSYWWGQLYEATGKEKALAGYEKAKGALKPELDVKDTQLVGQLGEDYGMNFAWRFTTEFMGKEYYIYVDAETGEKKEFHPKHW